MKNLKTNKKWMFKIAMGMGACTMNRVWAEEVSGSATNQAPPPSVEASTQPSASASTVGQPAVLQAAAATTTSRPKTWNLSYSNYMNGPAFDGPVEGSINHYVAVKRNFNSDWGLSLIARPDTNIGGTSPVTTWGDSYLSLAAPIYKSQSGGPTITARLQYYAPISQASREANLAGVIQPRVYLTQTLGRLELSSILIPKIPLNRVAKDGQKQFSTGNYLAASYTLSKWVSLDFGMYPEWSLKRNRGVAFNNLPSYPGATVNFTEKISLSPYMEVLLTKPEAKTTSLGGVLSIAMM